MPEPLTIVHVYNWLDPTNGGPPRVVAGLAAGQQRLGHEVRLVSSDRAGDPEVEFSYRLVATRRGYEGKRLEHAAWADNDPNLYPAQPATPQGGGVK